MIELLHKIVDKLLHRHRWEIIDQHNLLRGKASVGTRYILQCKHCGDVKRRDLE